MYRILIVDDEPFIVQGLANLCESTEGLEVEVYTAYSAAEALRWLARTRMDIVLSDIKMPGMGGLTLQKKIRRQWPRCKVIFLTAHDDFTYLQEATREGITDYILKTEGNDAVLRSLEQTIGRIEQEMKSLRLLDKATERMREAIPFLQKKLILDLAGGHWAVNCDLARSFADLELELHGSRPCLPLIIRLDEWKGRGPDAGSLYLYAVENMARELLQPMIRITSAEYAPGRLLCLLQWNGGRSGEETESEYRQRCLQFIHGMLEPVQSASRKLLKLKVSLAAAAEWTEWEGLADKFRRLKLLLGSGLGIGTETLLTEGTASGGLPGQEPETASDKHLKQIELLRACLEHGEKEEFERVLARLMEVSFLLPESSRIFNMELYYHLVSVCLPAVIKIQAADGEADSQLVDLDKLTRYDLHRDWNEAAAYISALAGMIFRNRQKGRNDQEHEVVKKVNHYIELHLAGDLSLTQISEAVGHNPSYLSRLYKQITGEGLSETITAARLAKAKQLLQDTDFKIHEIAAAVGFVSPPYFYRFFKKCTNLTPHEYRELTNR